MTDYHVVHLEIASGEQRTGASVRIQRECAIAAREGWYLHSVVPDLIEGSTRGLWLVFATADDGLSDDAAVATAAEILSRAADEEQPTPGF
jgi:hypothetical protein